jgi:hypothetical protein
MNFKSTEEFLEYSNNLLSKLSKKYKKLKAWKVFINYRFKKTSVLAYCYNNKTIGINHIFAKLNFRLNGFALLDVLMHEIAHALDFEYDGNLNHGASWKKWCNKIGATPDRLYRKKIFNRLNYKYAIVNKNTFEVYFTMKEIPDWCMEIHKVSLFGRPNTKGNLMIYNLY